MNTLTAYDIVIADLAQDIGWEDGIKEQYIRVLLGRVSELRNVFGLTEQIYEVQKSKFWVADDGSFGEGDILTTDRDLWTRAQNNALEHITDSGEPTIEDVVEIIHITKENN